MGLSKEDVPEIIQLLDDLKATELYLRTRHFTLTEIYVLPGGSVGAAPAGPGGHAGHPAAADRHRPALQELLRELARLPPTAELVMETADLRLELRGRTS